MFGTVTSILVKDSRPMDDREQEKQLRAELARLQAENQALSAVAQNRREVSLRVSQKGAVSLYGLGRFPVTLYQEQWLKLLDYEDQIRQFIVREASQLKTRASPQE